LTEFPDGGNIFPVTTVLSLPVLGPEEGADLPQAVRKELAVSVLTILGVLSTAGVSYLLRHVPALKSMAVSGEPHFVGLVIYGLAVSLVVSAALVMRARDTIILILAATIVWVVFVEVEQVFGMVRFLVFASVATSAVLYAVRSFARARRSVRVLVGSLIPALACSLAGLAYYGLAAGAGTGPADGAAGASRDLPAGLVWGFSLGVAVGLGLSVGREILKWMSKEGS
jgi:hypothetical protein